MTATITRFACDADDETESAAPVPGPRWDNPTQVTLMQGEVYLSAFADDRAKFRAVQVSHPDGDYSEITIELVDGTVVRLALSLPAQANMAAAITEARA